MSTKFVSLNNIMNNQHCWYEINLPTQGAIVEGWSMPKFDPRYPNQIWRNAVKFSRPWVDLLASKGLFVIGSLSFYRPPFCSSNVAHIDLKKEEPFIAGFNWVIGGKDSSMSWYKTPEGDKEIKYTPANTGYYEWPVEELDLVDRCHITDKLTMVRVDVPHSIEVYEEGRFCVSARIIDIGKTWEDYIEFLDKKGLLVTRN